MQIAAICFGGAHAALDGSLLHGSHCHCSDLEVGAQGIRHALWLGHPFQGIHIDIHLPCPVVQLKVVLGQAGQPLMTHCIQPIVKTQVKGLLSV